MVPRVSLRRDAPVTTDAVLDLLRSGVNVNHADEAPDRSRIARGLALSRRQPNLRDLLL